MHKTAAHRAAAWKRQHFLTQLANRRGVFPAAYASIGISTAVLLWIAVFGLAPFVGSDPIPTPITEAWSAIRAFKIF